MPEIAEARALLAALGVWTIFDMPGTCRQTEYP
jgi:hypothetical protein